MCSGLDVSALSPHGASRVEKVIKAKWPPDKEKGCDAADQHPASPWVVASALDAIIRGNIVMKGCIFFFGGYGGGFWCVCVCVCVCMCVAPAAPGL
jgi:hypothetical protein